VTRTIEIPIPDDLLHLVDEKAKRSGLKREEYIRTVLSREVTGTASITEILAPFREQVRASGATDEDLRRLFSSAREESYGERNSE
jgi:hypothetical protein